MELKEAISIVIKQERKKNGMSQEELAHLCNMDRTYISLLERKKRNPTLDVIFRMSNSFQMKPSTFVKMLEDIMHL
ncbi:DNA-binding XRE family transcriptional regulator [Lachnotalea glycerini]|uniref:XRE family transcriptional regulator n=1 Tax=Lachnotalea glycerini TaxID=1763509 RepID=A0A255S1L0_9FIRM|nr:helix-turn-helix transcriptional regulator [Lachnotalea glycerini]OYP46879.1 transcriptional regulator [Lachnotalea glycerini]PXV89440.1 DNA-binding XRE family transcriptional regulator [Lachnotalea glycerini]RDY32372.1 XRE family transcriptional regulator [Lachnotalea glycerini]